MQFDFVLPGTALVELSHDHEDQLPVDDKARLTLAPARRLRVLLVLGVVAGIFVDLSDSGKQRLELQEMRDLVDDALEGAGPVTSALEQATGVIVLSPVTAEDSVSGDSEVNSVACEGAVAGAGA